MHSRFSIRLFRECGRELNKARTAGASNASKAITETNSTACQYTIALKPTAKECYADDRTHANVTQFRAQVAQDRAERDALQKKIEQVTEEVAVATRKRDEAVKECAAMTAAVAERDVLRKHLSDRSDELAAALCDRQRAINACSAAAIVLEERNNLLRHVKHLEAEIRASNEARDAALGMLLSEREDQIRILKENGLFCAANGAIDQSSVAACAERAQRAAEDVLAQAHPYLATSNGQSRGGSLRRSDQSAFSLNS